MTTPTPNMMPSSATKPAPVIAPLRPKATLAATVIIDYQNIHLTGRDTYRSQDSAGSCVINPLAFAQAAIERRNASQKPGYPLATLKDVHVFRGLPSPEYDPLGHAYAQQYKHQWEKESSLVHVHHRPLKYRNDDLLGETKVGYEKGVDVMCAVAVMEHAYDPDTDLVLLATHDSDLEPALEAADELCRNDRNKRIESAGWSADVSNGASPNRRMQGSIWHTWLFEEDFDASVQERVKLM